MQNLFDLSERVALVTGASRGIGEDIAKLFASNGAHVIVSSRKENDCQRVVDEIVDFGGKAEALACHVGDLDAIKTALSRVRESHGKLDILVNNAAANPYYGHVLDTDLSSFEKTIDVNIRGYFFMSVEAGKIMKEQGVGAILNTASITALTPGDKQAVYSITKAAVVSMTKAFAKECGPLGIRVNALLPGLTKTKFAGALFENKKFYDLAINQIPLGREAAPSEQAGAALYLVSDAASYTTGACLVVDGGLTA